MVSTKDKDCEEQQRIISKRKSQIEQQIAQQWDSSPLRALQGGLVRPLNYNDIFSNLDHDYEISNLVKLGRFGMVRIDDRPKAPVFANRAFLMIDMNGNENEIVACVRNAHRIYQNLMPVEQPSRMFTGTNIRKLHSYKVLPYLDLKIWATNNNIEIPLSVYARALYPAGEQGNDHVRDTLDDYATWAMSEHVISSLRSMGRRNQGKK